MRVALAMLATSVLLVPCAEAAGTRVARVALVSRTPLTLAGAGFRAKERVRVTVNAGMLVPARTVTTGAAGTFRLTWSAVSVGGSCRSIVISAVGSKGTKVFAKLLPSGCAPSQP
jgi:hypothetical protein